jgi:hypothetical protein
LLKKVWKDLPDFERFVTWAGKKSFRAKALKRVGIFLTSALKDGVKDFLRSFTNKL